MTTYKKINYDGNECAVEYAVKAGGLGSAKGDASHPIYLDATGKPQVCTAVSAAEADTLTTGRTIRTDLASETAPLFDGSANITPGVTGVLPVAHGGTGNSTVDTTPTADSTKMVTSGGVQAQIAAEASSRVSDIANLVGQIATEKTTRADADNALGARIDGVINGTTPPTTISGVLPIQNGGTGSGTKDWADLSSDQNIGGTKSFTAGSLNINQSGTVLRQTVEETDGASTGSVWANIYAIPVATTGMAILRIQYYKPNGTAVLVLAKLDLNNVWTDVTIQTL